MPSIAFTVNGKSASYELAKKVTKEDLYGSLKRLVVKGDEVLERGYLTADGHPVPASAISTERLDPEGTLEQSFFLSCATCVVVTDAFLI